MLTLALGMMRGIREKAGAMAKQGPSYRSFTDAVSTLARNFREEELRTLIEDAMEQSGRRVVQHASTKKPARPVISLNPPPPAP